MPRALILGPQRRSIVSSMPTITGPVGTGRPPCVAEHAVVDGKAWGLLKAHDAQRRRDRPPTRREQGACHQHQGVAPDRGGEVALERPHPGGQHLGHRRRHGIGLRLGGCPRGGNPCRDRWARWPALMPCASGSKLTPGRAVVSRWYERTGATHCTADALAVRSRACGLPARVMTCRSCGGATRPGPPPATSGPSSCRSAKPSTSSPPKASSGSGLDAYTRHETCKAKLSILHLMKAY